MFVSVYIKRRIEKPKRTNFIKELQNSILKPMKSHKQASLLVCNISELYFIWWKSS